MTNTITMYVVAFFDGDNQLMAIERFRNNFPEDANLRNALHTLCVTNNAKQRGATAVLTKSELTQKTITL